MGTALRLMTLALLLGALPDVRADVPFPALAAQVTDETGTLSAGQTQALDGTLQAFESKKGSQIAVLIIPTTAPETIEQFGIRVADQWKIGRKRVDDGAILIVAKSDRSVRIEVGYGLEGALNDATSERIISEVIVPRFRQGDFYGGIAAGVDRMIRVIDGEPLPAPSASPAASDAELRQYAPVILILALIVGGSLRAALGRVPGAIVTGGALGLLAWAALGALSIALIVGLIGFLFTLLGGGMIGPLMGGMGVGGFGRGGFRGGGGGFGGGGASGRW